jgi:type IV pilus assembly protein PilB
MSRPLGELLVEQGLLTPARLETALVEQRQTKEYLGTLLVRKGWLSRQDLLPVLARQLGIRYMRLDLQAIDWSVAAKFSTTALTEHQCLAIAMDRHRVTVAVVNPLDMWGVSQVQEEAGGRTVEAVLVSEEDFAAALAARRSAR